MASHNDITAADGSGLGQFEQITRTDGSNGKRSLDTLLNNTTASPVPVQNPASNALLTLKFWESINFDPTTLTFVVLANSTPLIDSKGNLIILE